MESASKTLKRVTLELGGKDPAIVCEDVNIEEVAPKVSRNCAQIIAHMLMFNIDCSTRVLELRTGKLL